MSTAWRDIFEVVDYNQRSRQKCRLCGVVLDVRAGRATKHAMGHSQGAGGVVNEPSEVQPDKEPSVPAPEEDKPVKKGPPKGSREWAVQMVLDVADNENATPEQKLKALDLLKEFEGFESAGTFDDEVEKQKHLEQWERAISRSKELRVVLKKLVKDPSTRYDIERDLKEV